MEVVILVFLVVVVVVVVVVVENYAYFVVVVWVVYCLLTRDIENPDVVKKRNYNKEQIDVVIN